MDETYKIFDANCPDCQKTYPVMATFGQGAGNTGWITCSCGCKFKCKWNKCSPPNTNMAQQIGQEGAAF